MVAPAPSPGPFASEPSPDGASPVPVEPRCHHCDRTWPTEHERELRTEVEGQRSELASAWGQVDALKAEVERLSRERDAADLRHVDAEREIVRQRLRAEGAETLVGEALAFFADFEPSDEATRDRMIRLRAALSSKPGARP